MKSGTFFYVCLKQIRKHGLVTHSKLNTFPSTWFRTSRSFATPRRPQYALSITQ